MTGLYAEYHPARRLQTPERPPSHRWSEGERPPRGPAAHQQRPVPAATEDNDGDEINEAWKKKGKFTHSREDQKH